jgi:MFS transporter
LPPAARSQFDIYVIGHYGVSKPVGDALLIVIGAAALAGVFAGGRISDRLLRRGHSRARIIVPAACLLALVPVMAPAIATTSIALALPLFVVGAFLLGAPNPPMDAARLDIVHPRLWGRAEGVRTVLRMLGEAGTPLIFGYVSQYVFGSPAAPAGTSGQGSTSHAATSGLEYTFLIFLILLLAAGLLALLALRTYPRDVATATRHGRRSAAPAAAENGRPHGTGQRHEACPCPRNCLTPQRQRRAAAARPAGTVAVSPSRHLLWRSSQKIIALGMIMGVPLGSRAVQLGRAIAPGNQRVIALEGRPTWPQRHTIPSRWGAPMAGRRQAGASTSWR